MKSFYGFSCAGLTAALIFASTIWEARLGHVGTDFSLYDALTLVDIAFFFAYLNDTLSCQFALGRLFSLISTVVINLSGDGLVFSLGCLFSLTKNPIAFRGYECEFVAILWVIQLGAPLVLVFGYPAYIYSQTQDARHALSQVYATLIHMIVGFMIISFLPYFDPLELPWVPSFWITFALGAVALLLHEYMERLELKTVPTAQKQK